MDEKEDSGFISQKSAEFHRLAEEVLSSVGTEVLSRLVVEKGLDGLTDPRSSDGFMHLAAERGNAEARSGEAGSIEILVVAGADLEAKDGMGKTPLEAALSVRSDKVASRLILSGASREGLDVTSFLPLTAEAASLCEFRESLGGRLEEGGSATRRVKV